MITHSECNSGFVLKSMAKMMSPITLVRMGRFVLVEGVHDLAILTQVRHLSSDTLDHVPANVTDSCPTPLKRREAIMDPDQTVVLDPLRTSPGICVDRISGCSCS